MNQKRLEAITINTVDNDCGWKEEIGIYGEKIILALDSGAHANVMTVESYMKVKGDLKGLQQTDEILTSFSEHNVNTIGVATLECDIRGKMYVLEFHVVDCEMTNVLGFKAIQDANLVERSYDADGGTKTDEAVANEKGTEDITQDEQETEIETGRTIL